MNGLSGTETDVPKLFGELLNADHYQFEPLALGNFTAALIAAACGLLVLFWERGRGVSRQFAAFTTLFMLWAVGRGVLLLMSDPDLVVFLARRLYVLIMLCSPLLYQYAMAMLRLETVRGLSIRVHWMLGALVAFATLGTHLVIEGWQEFSWGYEPIFGPLGLATVAWVTVMILMASVDTVRLLRRTVPGSRERRRIATFAFSLLFLFTAAVDFLPSMGLPVFPFAYVGVTIFTLLTAGLTLHYGLIEVTPQLAAQEIAGLVRGALLILDRDGTIQFANPHAAELLGRRALAGSSGPELMGDALSPVSLALLASAEGREAEKELLYQSGRKTGPVRDLALSVAAVRDSHDRDVAYVCLLRDITDQKRAVQQRQSEGLRDSLTTLPGRAMFLELIDGAVKRASETRDYDFAVCFLGLDRLNVVNEDLGYAAGDQVLAEVARRLRQASRAQDVVARIGGDEFGILLEAANPEDVQRFVHRVMDAVRAPMTLAGHTLHVSCSLGVSESTQSYSSGAEALRDAGMAMYRVKQEGGGDFHIVTRSDRGVQRSRLESELHRALENGEFRVFYQPVLDLVERRVVGFEALVRWQHPEKGLVLPGAFIELAEQVGLARQIDLWVMERACSDLARFQEATADRKITMSVNMAEAALRDPTFIETVGAMLARHGVEPACLRIEVLERVAMITPLRSTLSRLRNLGVGIAIDDFGTGYSSLSRLHELPVSVLKVDREFVRGMSGPGGEKIINAIIALAQSLSLTLVAEGASQVKEVRRLLDFGCRYVQGFYFSQAVPYETALDLLRDPAQSLGEKFRDVAVAWFAPTEVHQDRRPGKSDRLGSRLGRLFGLR